MSPPDVERLAGAGLSADEAARKALAFREAVAALGARGAPVDRVVLWFVPGRVELLGKHTDYAGGRSLLCAAERGFCVASVPRDDDRVRVLDVGRRERFEAALRSAGAGRTTRPRPSWYTYPQTVVDRVASNFPGARTGVDVAFVADLPPAAGMSSSSALMIAVFLAISDANALPHQPQYRAAIRSPEDLAGYAATLENGRSFGPLAGERGVGTFGGSQDHTAILLAVPRHAVQYAFRPTRLERVVPLPEHAVIAIAASGVAARKTGPERDAYNRAVATAERVVEIWGARSGPPAGSLADICAAAPGAVGELMAVLSDTAIPGFPARELRSRLAQFAEESLEIVPGAAAALAAGDLGRFGALVARSQRLAETALGNQVAQTTGLARAARELGAFAASAFGAGFGGSVWALVQREHAAAFTDRWRSWYARAFPAHASRAEFFVTEAGPAAFRAS